jgi:hypothetical protein
LERRSGSTTFVDSEGGFARQAHLQISRPLSRVGCQPVVAERIGKSPRSFDARVISVLAVSAFDSAKRFWGEGTGSGDLIELIERSFEIASALGKVP